jgi:hypothetical protein
MKTQQLHDTLQQLHEELASADRVDPESERLLRELLGDISALIAAEESARESSDTGFAARLAEASKRFEEDHPGLVAAIGRVADALSRSGI